jgi:hypothetical protein
MNGKHQNQQLTMLLLYPHRCKRLDSVIEQGLA